jgi:hypothetical protein
MNQLTEDLVRAAPKALRAKIVEEAARDAAPVSFFRSCSSLTYR